ncbi:MAG: tetratricopeptide repeat protein [Proteobacteria bacterium]|nr:tetratricopeptide repeat protein [Pseudomonadota bacterium]
MLHAALPAPSRIGRHLLTVLAAALVGCAHVTQDAPPTEPVLAQALARADARFAPLPVVEDADSALRVSATMQAYLNDVIRPLLRKGDDPRRVLLHALLDQRRLRLEYDGGPTRNAAQAFDDRRGNCLSLVLMSAAFADEMGLRVRLRQVLAPPSFTHSEGLVIAAGHVNLSLAPPNNVHRVTGPLGDSEWVVDFLPGQDLAHQQVREVSRPQVGAMYLNNRAAEALAAGDLARAYALARTAVGRAPNDANARNTLAVVLYRGGLVPEAEAVLREVLGQAPTHLAALTNLHGLLATRAGTADTAEAAVLAQRLARLQPDPPYAQYERGRQALAQSRWAEARDALAQALQRAPEDPLVHHAMAQALLGLGRVDDAMRHLQQAQRFSTDTAQRQRFLAKLDALRRL